MAGFWVSPIVYSVSLVANHLRGSWLYLAYYLNPMTSVVVSSQRALYGKDAVLQDGTHVLADPGTLFYLERLGLGMIFSVLLLALGLTTFQRMSADFAEEL